MKRLILSPHGANNDKATQPDAERLRLIEEQDKKPEDCNQNFDFGICRMKHLKAKRLYKEAIAKGEISPKGRRKKDPCLYCQLIQDKIVEESSKSKSENAIDYEDDKTEKAQIPKVDDVTTQTDCESNSKTTQEVKKQEGQKVDTAKKLCLFCGKSFTPSASTRKYCSVTCRNRSQNAKRNMIFAEAKRIVQAEKKPIEPDSVNSYALVVKNEEPKPKFCFFTSPKHALTHIVDSLQTFNDVVDLILDKTNGVIRQLAIYLSDDIYTTNNRVKEYLNSLKGEAYESQ